MNFGAGGKGTHKVDTHKLKEADKLAEVYSVAVLNCHIPVAERSQWRRFRRLRVFGEDTNTVPCHKLFRLCCSVSHGRY